MSKYGNRKVIYNGIEFDSMKEAYRYAELMLMVMSGVISDLQLQVKFELVPAQKVEFPDGIVTERAVNYIADFVYKQGGQTVVEDTKGYKTTEYVMKRKLMLYVHGIRIMEV